MPNTCITSILCSLQVWKFVCTKFRFSWNFLACYKNEFILISLFYLVVIIVVLKEITYLFIYLFVFQSIFLPFVAIEVGWTHYQLKNVSTSNWSISNFFLTNWNRQTNCSTLKVNYPQGHKNTRSATKTRIFHCSDLELDGTHQYFGKVNRFTNN